MSEEDVTRAIIKPMRKLYPPPRHLRADEDDLDAALREYRRALGRFDQDVLEKAWERVVAEHQIWCWPKAGVFVKAAVQAQREMHPPGAVGQVLLESPGPGGVTPIRPSGVLACQGGRPAIEFISRRADRVRPRLDYR